MSKLAQVLTSLLKQHDISVSKLARCTGVAQPVIHRMTTGDTDNPQVKTLLPIANYFSITINQLIGENPLSENFINNSSCNAKLPIFTLEQIARSIVDGTMPKRTEFFSMMENVGTRAYVLVMQGASMMATFPEGAKLIINPALEPKCGDFAVIYLRGQKHAAFKQLFFDNEEVIAKSLNPDFKTLYINKNACTFMGVLVAYYVLMQPVHYGNL